MSDFYEHIKSDETLGLYTNEDFDVQKHTNELVQKVVIGEQLAKLSQGISCIEAELQKHVGDHHENLLAQATGITKVENSLSAIQARAMTLMTSVEKVHSRVDDSYKEISTQTRKLANLHVACRILRQITQCLSISKQLKQHLDNCPAEMTKAASCINELDSLIRCGEELSGVVVLSDCEKLVKDGRERVSKVGKLFNFKPFIFTLTTIYNHYVQFLTIDHTICLCAFISYKLLWGTFENKTISDYCFCVYVLLLFFCIL